MRRSVVMVLAAMSLSSCDRNVQPPEAPEQIVAKRAEARWNAMVAGDYEKAYGFLTPGFRGQESLEAYKGRFEGKTKWLEAVMTGIECEPDVCEAEFSTKYRFLGAPPIPPMDVKGSLKEKWVHTQGEWWQLPK